MKKLKTIKLSKKSNQQINLIPVPQTKSEHNPLIGGDSNHGKSQEFINNSSNQNSAKNIHKDGSSINIQTQSLVNGDTMDKAMLKGVGINDDLPINE